MEKSAKLRLVHSDKIRKKTTEKYKSNRVGTIQLEFRFALKLWLK